MLNIPTDPHAVLRVSVTNGNSHYDTTLDIFPCRLHPKEGFTKHDMAMTIIGMLDDLSRGQLTGNHGVRALAWQTLYHPCGLFEPGCVLPTDGIDHTAALFTIEGGHITLPDGTTHRLVDVAPSGLYPKTLRDRPSEIEGLETAFDEEMAMSLAAGFLDRLLPVPFAGKLERTRAKLTRIIAARAGRLVINPHSLSGSAASARADEHVRSLLTKLEWLWILAPDRGWAPTQFIHGDGWGEIVKFSDPDLFAAGRAIHDDLVDLPENAISMEAAIYSDLPHASAHERIELRQILPRVDEAIEKNVPLTRLKPQAAKRAKRRQALIAA